VIIGGELKIDHAKMEVIMKWPVPTNVTIVRSFVGGGKYLQKFISSFLSLCTTPRHKNQ